MDGLKPGRGTHNSRASHRPTSALPEASHRKKDAERYWLVRSMGRLASKQKKTLWRRFKQTEFAQWPDKYIWRRVYAASVFVLFVFSTLAGVVQPFLNDAFYGVTPAVRSVLPEPRSSLGQYLVFDGKEQSFQYNAGYTGASNGQLASVGQGQPRISASFAKEGSKGLRVTDPLAQTDFSLKPKFKVGPGKQDQNQLFYPLVGSPGYLVYSSQVASVKEDIVLEEAGDDRQTFEYELDLGTSLEPRLEENGSVGVYGPSLAISGNVSTSTDQDAALLDKLRKNAAKDKLMFVIPAPVVVESGKTVSSVSVGFELEGNKLTLVADNLKNASYPLSLDPSVYIESAAQLMRGNNETNVEFDVATEQFKKGTTTGARIDRWTDTTSMSDAVYGQSVAATGGYVYRAGGRVGNIKPEIISTTSSRQATNSGSFTMDLPAIRPAGDLYVATFCHDVAGTNVVTPPAGWTEYADLGEHAAYYKIGANVSGGNEAATYTWTKSGGTGQWAGTILRIRNFNPASIPNVTPTTVSNGSNVTPTYPAITATSPNTLLIRSMGVDTDLVESTGYSPTGHRDVSSVHSSGSGTGSACGFTASELYDPPASGSATAAATLVTAASDSYGASSLAINGITGTDSYTNKLEWAKFNSTNGSIEKPSPGSDGVACATWCNNSAYNLPTAGGSVDGAGLYGASMEAYNGYLYLFQGNDGGSLKGTAYIAKLGANGEPQLWHPTDPNQANWVYWYKHTSAYSQVWYPNITIHNGYVYSVGGDSTYVGNTGATDAAFKIEILPNGLLASPVSITAAPTAVYGAALQAYNGYLYLIGGAAGNGAALQSGATGTGIVYYAKILADGSIGAWQFAAADGGQLGFTTPRSSIGGKMSGIWGGYLYIAGGCAVHNTNSWCTQTQDDVQVASINADGTLDGWNTITNIKHKRFGSSFIAWQDSLYRFGGCGFQASTDGTCYDTHQDVQYGNINQDGDASTVSVTSPSGLGLCQGADPFDCNVPPAGTGAGQGGQMLSSTAILNGFLYNMGGCVNVGCTTTSSNISYTAIDSNGKLKRPGTCPYSTYGAWCVDNSTATGTGLAAAPVIAYNGFLYIIGGLTGSGQSNQIYRVAINADGSFSGSYLGNAFNTIGLNAYNANGLSYAYAYIRANPGGANPANLYIFGGCTANGGGAGCNGSANSDSVYKCDILTAGGITGCTTSGQLSITAATGSSGPGLALHAGAVYANYIYLMGGVSPGALDLKTVRYAKFDNSNNVVAVSGGVWTESSVEMGIGRRRGTAFGYNGYLYAVGGFEATINTPLDTIEFVKINVSDGSLISTNLDGGIYKFTQSAVTISQRWGLGLAVSNSYAYVIGGCGAGPAPAGCTTFDPTVQTFQVYNNDSGAPAGYTSANVYSGDRIGASAAVLNGYMYIAGGCTAGGVACTTATDDVQFAAIDEYGNLGGWANTTDSTLPAARGFGQLEVAGGSLYWVAGYASGGTASPDVYYGTPSTSTGNVSAWTAVAGAYDVPVGLGEISSAVWNNRIYVTGGYNGTTYTNKVYVSPSLSSGGDITTAWTELTGFEFNTARGGHTAVSYANNLYILGGNTGSRYLNDVQYAKINSNGTIGSWGFTTSLPSSIAYADGFAVNGYMYLYGGRTSLSDCTPRTLIAPVSANTSIVSGNNPTGIGEWYQTNRNFVGGKYGNSAVSANGKAYVLGGGCQGLVMQDDFDPGIDGAEWANTTGMTAGTACQSTSSSNVMYTNNGSATNLALTKQVDVSNGGTVYFRFYSPSADTGTCFKREADTGFLGGTTNPENVLLTCTVNGSTFTTMQTFAWNGNFDPLQNFAVNIPGACFDVDTQFRWRMDNGEANDSFALEDVYIIANSNSSVEYTSPVSKSSLLSQPQVASYSRLIDAGRDVYPTKWLLNGIDNAIGARWQYSYRSMNDSTVTDTLKACGGTVMTGFGQLTNFGDVTLGQPENYTVKDAAGTSIGCSRYFFMNVSIDASKTYGYPEDISRGPTLDNLTLFFRSNPGQRLIHGKTFIEGTQQPLDSQPGP